MLIDVAGRAAYAYTGGKRLDLRLPLVVMVHGAQHDHSVWALQSRYLAHHGRAVLAVDLPGHGRSAGPALSSVEAMADWVLGLVAAVGASFGTVAGTAGAGAEGVGSTEAGGGASKDAGGLARTDAPGAGRGAGCTDAAGARSGAGSDDADDAGSAGGADAAGARSSAENSGGAGAAGSAGSADAAVAAYRGGNPAGTGAGAARGVRSTDAAGARRTAPDIGMGRMRASIVGHSMGSLVALEAAARGGDTIESIALLAIAHPMQVSDALLGATRNDEARAIEMVSLWSSESSYGGFSQKPSAPGPGFGVVAGGRRLMRRQAAGVMHTDFVACNGYRNGDEAAGRVACPTLAILGGCDAMTPPRSGRAIASKIAGARIVEIAQAGHFLMAEAPDATLDALSAFLPRDTTS